MSSTPQAKPAATGPRDVTETGTRRALIVVAVMMTAFLETLDSTIVNVALPNIEGNIGADIAEGAWIITSYIVANVVSIPLNPFLISVCGRRAYFLTCVMGFTIASCLCGTADSIVSLVCYRVIQGAFGGGLIATSQSILGDTFPPKQLAISSGLFAIAVMIGPALGPVIGGLLTDNLSWQWIFYVNAIPGVIAFCVLFALLRDPEDRVRTKIDFLSIAFLAAGLGSFQYVLDNGQRLDWYDDSGVRLGTLVAILGVATFVFRQLTTRMVPVVDLSVFRRMTQRTGTILAFAFGITVYAPNIIVPIYGSLVLGYTSWTTGVLLGMRAVPVLLLTPVFATLAEQRTGGTRYIIGGGFAMTALSLWWLASNMTSNASYEGLMMPLLLSGVAQSMILVPLIVGVMGSVTDREAKTAIPIINLFVQLGGSVGVALAVIGVERRTSLHYVTLAATETYRHLASAGQHMVMPMIQRMVGNEAITFGFADTVLVIGGLSLVATALSMLFFVLAPPAVYAAAPTVIEFPLAEVQNRSLRDRRAVAIGAGAARAQMHRFDEEYSSGIRILKRQHSERTVGCHARPRSVRTSI